MYSFCYNCIYLAASIQYNGGYKYSGESFLCQAGWSKECEQACTMAGKKCVGFNLDGKGQCCLLRTLGSLVAAPGFSAGAVIAPACYSYRADTTSSTTPIRCFKPAYSKECETACNANSACKAFTLSKWSDTCCLLSDAGTTSKKDKYTLAIKGGCTPAPIPSPTPSPTSGPATCVPADESCNMYEPKPEERCCAGLTCYEINPYTVVGKCG